MNIYASILTTLGLVTFWGGYPSWANAQSIRPAADGTNTIVTPAGDRIDITGGTQSGDGANLFHSFQEFGLTPDQVANFLVTPEIQNILGRVNGGNPSVINGILQVSGGKAHLYLMNPAGVIFGPDSALNLTGGLTVTTADGIGFEDGQFTAVGSPDYAALVGQPDTFVFSIQEPGAIVNAGDLAVPSGEQLTLLGGTVINTGTLTAPGGTVTVAAVSGGEWVRISQEEAVLSLELPIAPLPESASVNGGNVLTPLDLPTLLTGEGGEAAVGVVVQPDGTVILTGSEVALPTEAGSAIASGSINTDCTSSACTFDSPVGGNINVLGETVGVVDGTLTASGTAGGGEILVGGDYLGQGAVPTAEVTVVDSDSTLTANATDAGAGGRIIVWSDLTSRIAGEIQARGGAASGDGGFVETSSAGFLELEGTPDVTAPAGTAGNWLIDPSNIEIGDFGGTSTGISPTAPFVVADTDTAQLAISDLLAALTGGANVTLTTTGTPGDGDGNITLSSDFDFDGTGANSLTLLAANQVLINAPIFDSNAATNDRLNLTLEGDVFYGQDIDILVNAAINTNGGDLTLNGPSGVDINAPIATAGGDFSLSAEGTLARGQGVTLDAPITTSGGAIAIASYTHVAGQSGLVVNAPFDSGSGSINLNSRGSTLSDPAIAINTPLDLTSNEAITFTGRINGGGNFGILLDAPINTNGTNLTLNSFSGVAINNGAAIDTAGGNFILDGNSGTISGQGVTLNAPITTSGGIIDIAGLAFVEGEGRAGLAVNAPLNAGGGAITLTGQGRATEAPGLSINTPLDLDSEDITLIGRSSGDDNVGILVAEPIRTNGNHLTLEGESGVDVNALIDTAGGDLTVNADGYVNWGGEGVTLNAPVRTEGGAINIFGYTDEADRAGLDIRVQPDAGGGSITLEGEGELEAGPGLVINTPFDIANGEDITFTGSVSGGDNFGIVVAQPITTNGNDLTLDGSSGVAVEAPIATAGGNFTIEASGVNGFSGQGVTLNAPIDTDGGAIAVTGLTDEANQSGLVVNSQPDSGGGIVTLTGLSRQFSDSAPGLVINTPFDLNGEELVLSGQVRNRDSVGLLVAEPIRTNGGNLVFENTTGAAINAPINTNGGDFAVNVDGVNATTNFNVQQGITLNAPIRTAGGAIDVTGFARSVEGASGLVVNAPIDPEGGPIVLAGRGNSGTGPALVINTPLTLNGEDLVLEGGVSFGRSLGIVVEQPIATNGGNLTLNGGSGVDVNAAIATNGGDFTINAPGANLQGETIVSGGRGQGVTLDAPIRTSGGAINVVGFAHEVGQAGLVINAQPDPEGGTITLTGRRGNSAGPALIVNTPFELNGEDLTLEGSVFSGRDLGIVVEQPIRTNGGNLTLNGFSGAAINAPIETAGGDFTLDADGTSNFGLYGQGVTLDAPIRTSGGAIDIIAMTREADRASLVLNAPLDPGGGPIALAGRVRAFGTVPAVIVNTPINLNGQDLTIAGNVRGGGNDFGILVEQPIRTNGGNLLLEAPSGVDLNAPIETAGGEVTINAEGVNSNGVSIFYGQGVSLDAPIRTNGGGINVTGFTDEAERSGLAVNAPLEAGTGSVTLTGRGQSNGDEALVINAPLILDGADLTLTGGVRGGTRDGILVEQPIRTNGGNLIFNGTSGLEVNASVETVGGDLTIIAAGEGAAGQPVTINTEVDVAGGDVLIQSLAQQAGIIEVFGNINTRNGATITLDALNNLDAGDISNPGGDIQIISERGAVTTGFINTSNPNGSAGNILVETQTPETFNLEPEDIPTDGRITTDPLLAESSNGAGGDITITASGDIADITTGNITTIANNTGAGGDITITTPDSINTVGGSLVSIGATTGGNISLKAGSDIDTADIEILLVSGFIQDSGSIALTSTGGDVDTSAGALISSAENGNGGDITLDAVIGDLTLGTVDARSLNGEGGQLTFTTGQDITLATGSVSTNNNNVEFNHRVRLTGDAVVNSFGTGDVVFNTPVDGAYDLTVNAGSGAIILDEVVGGNTPLTNFAFQGILRATLPSGLDINADQITLLGDTTITGNSSIDIILDTPLDGFYNLTLDPGLNGDLVINAPIGRNSPLNSFTALEDIITTNNTPVSIATVNGITTQDITATGGINLLSANGPITAGDLNTAAMGDAGDVAIATSGQATVNTINAQSGMGRGGDVDVTANGFFQVTETFTDQNGQAASIAVAGNAGGGTVVIRHGGEGVTPFTIGDPSVNGTAGRITRGGADIQTIAAPNSFLNTYTQDGEQLQLISVPAEVQLPTVDDPEIVPTSPSEDMVAADDDPAALSSLIGDLLDAATEVTANSNGSTTFQWTLPDGEEIDIDVEIPSDSGIEIEIPILDAQADQPDLISLLDEDLEEEFEEHFGREWEGEVNAQTIQTSLQTIETQTGTRAVVVYAIPQADRLELILVRPEGDLVLMGIPEARAEVLQRTIDDLATAVRRPRGGYQTAATQLYDWLIQPLQHHLDALQIDTLIFAMDAGLRGMPLAALYDEEREQFLVEQYSLGLVPSFSLTDSRYQSLQDRAVTTLGIADFGAWPSLNNLPYVATELAAIADLWPGEQHLDQRFTLSALEGSRQQSQLGVIHLATHAKFEAEDPRSSFIQLWDTQLGLDQLYTLDWNAPPTIEMLVLSACATALGSFEAELGFAGLAVNAGVKSAVASLWNVNDASTALLMEQFYTALRTTPIKAEALRQAQLALLQGDITVEDAQERVGRAIMPAPHSDTQAPPDSLSPLDSEAEERAGARPMLREGVVLDTDADYSHPYYWAAFTMIGSPW